MIPNQKRRLGGTSIGLPSLSIWVVRYKIPRKSLSHSFQLRGALRAAGGFDRNSRETVRAFFGGRRNRGRFRLTFETVHLFYQKENDKGDDNEIDDRIDEKAIVEYYSR